MSETLEEMTSRHKKEIKSFEGDKRAAIKNAKSRGKKGKAALKEAEFKYTGLERDLKQRHKLEMEQLAGDGGGDDADGHEEDSNAAEKTDAVNEETATSQPTTQPEQQQQQPTPEQIEETKRQKALQKKLKKKNAQRQQELDREKRIQEENAAAGPSRRQMELEALQTLYLHPRGLDVEEVEADGNCLYRAVGVQCRRLGLDAATGGVNGEEGYGKIRSICADALMGSNRAEYEPFAECGEGHAVEGSGGDAGNHPATFEEYVNNVRSTSTWGGQLELRALSEGLECPIVVFSAEGPPLTMGAEYASSTEEGGSDEDWNKKKALLLSFHRH
ncbi:hypothetical protein ACHAXR_001714, partial [Thalassiosira sp. AJA248-18]